jgi:hypothetical protein
MKKKRVRPNDPCRCGSGRKLKKCCGAPGAKAGVPVLPHTQADRAAAFEELDFFIDELWEEEEDEAVDAFWGRHLGREDELPPDLLTASREVQQAWFSFDHRLDDGARIIDHFLEQAALSRGERSFLLAMRQSTMRLYEVTDTVPGSTMTLCDLVEGTVVTVRERTGSRFIARHECLAARVIPRGCSGKPEIELGVLHVPALLRDSVLAAIKEHKSDFLREHPAASADDFYKLLPPLFHDAWLSSIFEPAVPELANTDGEKMVWTRVSFHVEDAEALARALDAAKHEGLARVGEHAWGWSGPNASGSEVSLASLELRGDGLTVEANSVARGQRVRALVERLAGGSIRYRATSHEDMRRKVMEGATALALGREESSRTPAGPGLDPDVAEALVLQHYSRHYRAWIDEPVPALDGITPREAAKSRALRPRLEDLIHGLERMYEQALKNGQPAYDPSWMWAELELAEDAGASHPPLLAHERVAERVPGSAEASRAAAERCRVTPSFSDTSTTLGEDDLKRDLELQRFLRRERASANDAGQEGAAAAPYLPLMVNFDLHRRKVFWVDAALSYMLENTDVSVAGGELRGPFPSFAVVLTDRHALSLGERLLARSAGDPLRGQILRVITVYVTEQQGEDGRFLAIVLAFDALGADLPSLVRMEIPAGDETSVRSFLDSVAPRPVSQPEVHDTSPLRGLLRLIINAVLYATSADVTPEIRSPALLPRRQATSTSPAPSSDSVFFLPGKIDIRRVRQMQDLERAPGGRAMLARFLVRGHWRRPLKGWSDQRLRWIEPYWKGPDMAAVIEKAYRLKA